MANVINITEQIEESVKDLPDYNYMLGRTLMQPFKPANSGSRALMNSVHVEHLMVPNHGEVPIIQTGYETEFGRNSSSYITNDSDYVVLHKINKFEFNNDHYFLIIQDMHTQEYDVIERVSYNYNTESYGYLWNNERIDLLKPGDTLRQGEILKTSIGFDEFGNKMNGVNLVTLYLSCAQNMEDSVIISESCAKKLETSLVKNTPITINDNDILLNLYGNENRYKTFPDIGEEVKNGIFCSIRRMENENILFTMSQQNLRDIMISDRNILMEGKVADINVYCNNPEALGDSHYNSQLFYYYNQSIEFCKKVNDIVGPLAMTSRLSHRLKKFYGRCRDVVAGKQFFKEKQFNHVIMEVTVIQNLPMEPGDKLADRYGGKGVVSMIMPDELMPELDNGKRVEVIKNQSTCINRENIGQLHEQSLSFIGTILYQWLIKIKHFVV
jgi:DNA-directed RNA polymerase beta subunit